MKSLALIVLAGILVGCGREGRKSSVFVRDTVAQAPSIPEPPPAPAEPIDPWGYPSLVPEMSKGVIHWASTTSTNELRFSFPYGDPQRATLDLIAHPVHGNQLTVSFDHGQFICPSYDGCSVRVRFDEDDPMQFSAMPPSDNSTTKLFLQGYQRFVTRMKRARRVRISATVYQQGAPVMDFDVFGFDQAKFMAKPAAAHPR